MVRKVPTRAAESCSVQLYNPKTSSRYATTANPTNIVNADLHCVRYRQQQVNIGGIPGSEGEADAKPAQTPGTSTPATESSPSDSSPDSPQLTASASQGSETSPSSSSGEMMDQGQGYTGAERTFEDKFGKPTGMVPGLGVSLDELTRQAEERRNKFLDLYKRMEEEAVEREIIEERKAGESESTDKDKDKDVRTKKPTWTDDHLHILQDMNTIRFRMSAKGQRMIYEVMKILVDTPYNHFGKIPDESWDCYTLMFRNGFKGRDDRKPIAAIFQDWCEKVYTPIIWTLLFSRAGWEELKKHYAQFKSCTVLVCEDTNFWGQNIFHMHIDGKIGILHEKNYLQKKMNRLLFSIVREGVADDGKEKEMGDEFWGLDSTSSERSLDTLDVKNLDTLHLDTESRLAKIYQDPFNYGTTVYPVWQPKKGFKSNHEYHAYMQIWYNERGLENCGLPRPHYEIPDNLVYRATSGEVLLHKTHATGLKQGDGRGPQEVHAEPNPCPERHLFVFDWNNCVFEGEKDEKGRQKPSVNVPGDRIIGLMEEGLGEEERLGEEKETTTTTTTSESLMSSSARRTEAYPYKASKQYGSRFETRLKEVLEVIDKLLTGKEVKEQILSEKGYLAEPEIVDLDEFPNGRRFVERMRERVMLRLEKFSG